MPLLAFSNVLDSMCLGTFGANDDDDLWAMRLIGRWMGTPTRGCDDDATVLWI